MNFRTALALLFCAVTLAAADPRATYQAGREAMRRGDHAKAAELLEEAVRLEPNNSMWHYALAGAYGGQIQNAGIFKKASLAKKSKGALDRAIELDPNNLEARMALIEYLLQAPAIAGGSEAKAEQQAAEIRKRNAITGHRAMARIHQHRKKPELAVQEMVAAVREQPNSADAHYYYGATLFNQKNYKDAAAEFENALKLDPNHRLATFRIGQLAAVSGTNYPRGEEMLKKYLTFTPGDTDVPLARAWYWLGQIYEKQGKKAEAKQAYAASLKLTPGAKDVAEALKRVS